MREALGVGAREYLWACAGTARSTASHVNREVVAASSTSASTCRTVFLFLQAEDGIRDIGVTGVQTCALPICRRASPPRPPAGRSAAPADRGEAIPRGPSEGAAGGREDRHPHPWRAPPRSPPRSGERRVGKACRSPCSPYHLKKYS